MVRGAYAPRHRWRRSIQVARLPPGASRGLHAGASRGFQGPPKRAPTTISTESCQPQASGASRNLQTLSKNLQGPFTKSRGFQVPIQSCPAVSRHLTPQSYRPPGAPVLFQLLRTFSVQRKGVVLLTKMDLTEFRS